MLEKVLETVRSEHMLEQGDAVLTALSGGADSVCLLLCLLDLREAYGLELSAVHINHGLRGEESERDRRFCEELCARLGVPLTVEHADVKGQAAKAGQSLEEAARQLRYGLFEKHAAGKIATAHTLQDSAETVLFNLARGTGLKGLCGIPPLRGSIIRPLIRCTRQEVEAELSRRGQPFVTDSSNRSPEFSRNRLRWEALPVLQSVNPVFLAGVGKMTTVLTQENDFLEGCAKDAYAKAEAGRHALRIETLKALHPAVARRCLGMLLEAGGLSKSFERILALENLLEREGQLGVADGLYVQAKKGILSVCRELPAVPDIEIPAGVGTYRFLDKTAVLSAEAFPGREKEGNVNRNFAIDAMDYDKIQGKVVLRNRRSGDRIQLLNRNFHSSVKKLLNAQVPAEERSRRIFLADEAGVLYIEGIGISDRVRLDENTKTVLKLVILRSVNN